MAEGSAMIIPAYLLAVLLTANSTRFSIEIAAPHVHLIDPSQVRAQCRTALPVDGCTEFLGEILRCNCQHDGDAWNIHARAQLLPYIYVFDPKYAGHERMHVEDLQHHLQSYLGELTAHRYADEESCRRVASFEMAVFNLRMDLLRADSNQRLH
jgi:hypothetical protein